jgi:YD repeat-containing protein
MDTSMPKQKRRNERGIALLLALFALVVVTSIGLGMMFLSDTETAVNANFRDEQTAYYAAKAGLEEARDRMQVGATNSVNASLPAALPGNASSVLYITNPSASDSTIQPWLSTDKYFDDQICKEMTCGGSTQPTTWHLTSASASSTYAASPVMPYKWARIMLKVNKSATGTSNTMYVNGSNSSTSLNYQACWNGANEVVASTSCSGTMPVYEVTSLAVTPGGSRRMLQYEIARVMVNVDASVDTVGAQTWGDALNGTGNSDTVCNWPAVYGAKSASTITEPGGGNITGKGSGLSPNSTFPFSVPSLVSKLAVGATSISSATGVTGSGTPTAYSGPHAVLGQAPTVTYDGNGGITAITAPGSPTTYYSNGNLSLGVSTIGGAAVSGQGVLLVNGNLTIDITNGFNYFGLIVVTGNITMTANSATSATSNIHGAIVGGGTFNSNLTNLGGSIFIHYNGCMVQNSVSSAYTMVSGRELMY